MILQKNVLLINTVLKDKGLTTAQKVVLTFVEAENYGIQPKKNASAPAGVTGVFSLENVSLAPEKEPILVAKKNANAPAGVGGVLVKKNV